MQRPWQAATMGSQLLFQEHLNIAWTAPVPTAEGFTHGGGHTSTLRQSVHFLQRSGDDSGRKGRKQTGSHKPLKYCFMSAKLATSSPLLLCFWSTINPGEEVLNVVNVTATCRSCCCCCRSTKHPLAFLSEISTNLYFQHLSVRGWEEVCCHFMGFAKVKVNKRLKQKLTGAKCKPCPLIESIFPLVLVFFHHLCTSRSEARGRMRKNFKNRRQMELRWNPWLQLLRNDHF